MRALALAVRDHLRDNAQTWYGPGFAKEMVEISPEGQPFAASGEFFIGICEGGWSGTDIEGLYEVFGISLVVSLRGAKVPIDRWGPELLAKAVTGLWDRVAEIRAQLHLDVNSDDIINRANVIIGPTANGFVEPPRLRDGGRSQKRQGSWWYSDNKEGNGGVSMTIVLADAGRVQRSDGPMT